MEFDADSIKKLLFSGKTIVYLTVCCLIVVLDYFMIKYMFKLLRNFELDAVDHDTKL